MSHVFPRNSNALPPIGLRGDGVYLIDADGKHYFDGSGGAAVSCLGHSYRDVIDAIKTQLDSMAFAHTSFLGCEFVNTPADTIIPDTVIVTSFAAPEAILPIVHGNAVQPPPVTLVIPMFVGVSVMTTLFAVSGPEFETIRV